MEGWKQRAEIALRAQFGCDYKRKRKPLPMITAGQTYKELTAGEITKQALIMLEERGVRAYRQNNLTVRHRKGIVTPGIPDIQGRTRATGIANYIEVKKIGDTLKPAQIKFMIEAIEDNCICMVATQVKAKTELIDFVEYYSKYKVEKP